MRYYDDIILLKLVIPNMMESSLHLYEGNSIFHGVPMEFSPLKNGAGKARFVVIYDPGLKS